MPISHPHEYYVDLVNRAQKTPLAELTSEEWENGHEQFGSNFYCLFISRLGAEKAPDPQQYRREDIFAQKYLRRAEIEYQQEWAAFLGHNNDLVRQIDTALDGVFIYLEIKHHYKDLLNNEMNENQDISSADAFAALGFEEVGICAWRQLNPLLEQASAKMVDEGINPKEFFS